MIRFFFVVLLLLLFASNTFAQSFLCVPKTGFTPNATGSSIASVVTSAGKADGFWCPNTNGKYTQQYFIVLNKYTNLTNSQDIIRRIIAAPDMITALNTELKNNSIVPNVGSQDEYEYFTLQYKVCQLLWEKPYLTFSPELNKQVTILPPKQPYCGNIPKLPIDVYKTPLTGTSLTIYKVSSNGTSLSSIISGKKAIASAVCDCSKLKIANGASAYCPLAGGIASEVTLCRKTLP